MTAEQRLKALLWYDFLLHALLLEIDRVEWADSKYNHQN
jgi:hypothetical protein